MVLLLHVLSIFHISICLPLRWLTGNCGDLEQYDFGVSDMPKALDLMDKAFAKIIKDGDLILDDDFVMQIFKPLMNKLPPLKEYMTFIFEEKHSIPIGSRKFKDKVLPWDMLRDELFYPSRKDIIQSNMMSATLGVCGACRFQGEFRDTTKATKKYLGAVNGAKSTRRAPQVERLASQGVDATNSVSERLHGASI